MFRNYLKKIILIFPLKFLRVIVKVRDWIWYQYCKIWEKCQRYTPTYATNRIGNKKRILVYALHGLRHAGTERNLQLIANSLADKYEVFYMYGQDSDSDKRVVVLHKNIVLVPFTYTEVGVTLPNKIYDMSLRISDVISQHNIDCLITASPGYTHYPWNLVRDIPIVLLNIFGAPTLQPNVKKVIYNSNTTRKHAEKWIGQDSRAEVRYAPLFALPPPNVRELGSRLREKLRIKSDDFVFGRIGRDDDGIFDSIGIRAWQEIVAKYPNSHYLIMSPPPALVKIVREERIKQVHFLPPSSLELDVWSFHGALDAMAHFRFDGETSGVAIAESLSVGNPIISHRSHIWNAHTNYLTEPHSIVTNKDDVTAYAEAMEIFITDKNYQPELWATRKATAKSTGDINFCPIKYSGFINNVISEVLNNT